MTNKTLGLPEGFTDVIEGVHKTAALLNYMLGERGQLYGTVIYLMELLGKNDIAMPSVESMKEYHKSFLVNYALEEDGFHVKLIEQPILPKEEDGDEDS